MPEAVYRMVTLLSTLVAPLRVGTNLGLLHLLWMLVSGRLLEARGAVIPGLSGCGLPARAVRRAWAALGGGDWAIGPLLARWGALVGEEGHWRAHRHGGYRPVAVDVTAFWRPRLQGCPTAHYHAEAGRALPAIPADPRTGTHERLLVREAARQGADDEALVLDAGVSLAEGRLLVWQPRADTPRDT